LLKSTTKAGLDLFLEAEYSWAGGLPDDEIPWGAVGHLEVGGEGAEATVTRQPEGGVTVEHFPRK
jgi:hypothetical protein